jgi:anti-sigma factor RsiW
MRCEEAQAKLEAFVSGSLPPEERLDVTGHLRDCAACRAALARLDNLAAVLVRANEPPLPEGFTSRVMSAAVRRRAEPRTARWNPIRWWRMVSVPMRAAAAIVLVLGVAGGLVMGWDMLPNSGKGPSAGDVVQNDPLRGYNVDYLGDAPDGSLADSYLTLLTGQNGEGQ